MKFSVWNQPAKQYDYYMAPGAAGENTANVPAPKHLKQRTLGLSPEQASWPLPKNAHKIGTGPTPIGRIAHPSAPLSGVPEGNTMTIALLGLAAVLLWKYVK